MKKVTGIGGIFFKCKDPAVVKEWYSKNLEWSMMNMVQCLNGSRLAMDKKGIHNERLLTMPLNIFSLLQKSF
ncbi:MAG: hypothetical protein ABI863_04035 [Ginsengibacter sp.]